VTNANWTIERLVPGGDGLARLPDGRIGFATGAVPGDLIRVGTLEQHKSWVRARDWELLRPSERRVQPSCVVAERCGGCDWMHLERAAQLEGKAVILREALTRTGGIRQLPGPVPVVTAGPDFGYRLRLRLHVDEAGRVGLYEKRSHDIVEISGCPVADPEIEAALRTLRQLAAERPRAMSYWSEVEIRVAPAGPRLTLALQPRARDAPRDSDVEKLQEELAARWLVSAHGEDARPEADQRFPLPGGIEMRSPPGGFVQVNWAVNLELVGAVVTGALERGARNFLDLYCGAGNFTLPLLAAGLEGTGVERAGATIRAARRAARDARLVDDSFVAADVSHELERRARRGEQLDLVVIDPPRSGAREAMPYLIRLASRHVALCSCDPVTLARDLRALIKGGYALESVVGFDMFPQTHHLEALAWLRFER